MPRQTMLRQTVFGPMLLSSVLLIGLASCRSKAPGTDGAEPAAEPPPAPAAKPPVEARSLLGQELLRPELDDDFRRTQEALLAAAQAKLDADPYDADALIWVGRRLAYLGRYRDAIDIYSRGIARHPNDARIYRHRGHRYITIRRFDRAIDDLQRAAELIADREPEVEPDGLPNARNVPTGNTHTAVWYHLGLAQYLSGDFEKALDAYRECLRFSDNPDMIVATSHWLYMTLRRLGRDDEAARVLEPISADMDVIENHEYLRLMMMYKGETSPSELLADTEGSSAATLGYGVGNWYFYNGDPERALEIFQGVLEGDAWAAFGYIAAEAEVARLTP